MWNKILYVHIHEMKNNKFDLQQNIILLRTNYYVYILYIYYTIYIYIYTQNLKIFANLWKFSFELINNLKIH